MSLKSLYKSSRGSMIVFFVAVLVPLGFFLLTFVLDFQRYFATRDVTQRIIDDAAMYGYRFMPRADRVKSAVSLYLSRYPDVASKYSAAVSSDAVTINYNGSADLVFPKILGLDGSMPLSLLASATGLPVDALVVLDTSGYLAPNLTGTAAWGDSISWPEAQFFSQYGSELLSSSIPDMRVATQQCFNPLFTSLKRAAIKGYEELSNFHSNSVGLAFYPAAGGGAEVVRSVAPVTFARQGEVDWGPGQSATAIPSDYCVAAAEIERYTSQYQFPSSDTGLMSLWVAPDSPPSSRVTPGIWNFDDSYRGYLSAGESIWAQSARSGLSADFAGLLRTIKTELTYPKSVVGRDGLSGQSSGLALVVAGDVPRVRGLRYDSSGIDTEISAEIAAIEKLISDASLERKITIAYLLTDYPGSGLGVASNMAGLASFFKAQSTPHVELRLIYSGAPESLAGLGVNAVLQERRTAVLAK